MTNYRRARITDATYFFTVNIANGATTALPRANAASGNGGIGNI